jgi:hypothetical protein
VHFAHADGALWACFSGLQIGSVINSFAGLRVDVDNSGGAFATSSDLGFFVGRDGVPFTARGNGVGGFPADAVPNGLTAAVSQDAVSGLWNAELRIDETKVGGWNHLLAQLRRRRYRLAAELRLECTGDVGANFAGAFESSDRVCVHRRPQSHRSAVCHYGQRVIEPADQLHITHAGCLYYPRESSDAQQRGHVHAAGLTTRQRDLLCGYDCHAELYCLRQSLSAGGDSLDRLSDSLHTTTLPQDMMSEGVSL